MLQRFARFAAPAVVDDNGSQLAQHCAEQRKLLQMIPGDEGQVVELVVGRKAVAPALVFRGDDEGTCRQTFATSNLQANAGQQAHGLHHPLHVTADDPAGRRASGGECGEGGGRCIGNGKEPVGDVET